MNMCRRQVSTRLSEMGFLLQERIAKVLFVLQAGPVFFPGIIRARSTSRAMEMNHSRKNRILLQKCYRMSGMIVVL